MHTNYLAVLAPESLPIIYPYKIQQALLLDAVVHYPTQPSSFALNKLLFSPQNGFVPWFLAVPTYNQL